MSRAAPSASGNMHKPDRKTVEKNRRIHMKQLCCRLTSLIPPQHFNGSRILTQQDQLDLAASYIKQLKERIDYLKVNKEELALMRNVNNLGSISSSSSRVPVVKLRESSSRDIEVIVVAGLENNMRLCDVIMVLQEEGAYVVSTNISRVGDRVFHTLHAQVKLPRVGVDTSRILQRLQEMMCLGYLGEDMQLT